MSYDYPSIEPRLQSSVQNAHDFADQNMQVKDTVAWDPDLQTDSERTYNGNTNGTGYLGQFFDKSEQEFDSLPEATSDQPVNVEDLYDRYTALPATQRPSNPGWNTNVKPSSFEGPNASQGPVNQLFFSAANVRQIGDYLEKNNLGRPSATELFDDMLRIYQEAPDFYEFGPIRTRQDVILQLMRLNSLLLKDIMPKYKVARWSWEKYQQDQFYGYGHQLLDRPESDNHAKQYIEFNNRM